MYRQISELFFWTNLELHLVCNWSTKVQSKMSKIITSTSNPLIKRLIRIRTHDLPKLTPPSPSSTVLISGRKMITELCSKFPAKTMILTENCTLPPEVIKPQHIYKASDRVVKRVSGLQTTDGFVAEVEVPHPVDLKALNSKSIIVFDNLTDPGNLGTLLRTAAAFRFECAVFIQCVNVFNDKCLRAARGATWKIPLAAKDWKTLGEIIKERNLACFVAKSDPKGIMSHQVKELTHIMNRFNGFVLVLGNEARGVKEDELKLWVPEKHVFNVHIPMEREIESLNVSVAGGILMHVLQCCDKI